jgi:hypothetical protein
MSSKIQVRSGGVFDPLDPNPADVYVEDIARSLSQRVRFGGHGRRFYSVAEHSVHVSRACGGDAFWGLLHDASEAYLGDLVTPLKRSAYGEAYLEAEARVMAAICARFDLPAEQPSSVSIADKAMLARERALVFEWTWPDADEIWAPYLVDVDESVLPEESTPAWWPWELAEQLFLARFTELSIRHQSHAETGRH